MEQYANVKISDMRARVRHPETKTFLTFRRLMEAANLSPFEYLKTQIITDICSLHDPKSFP